MLRDTHIRVRYNTPGHEREWTIFLPGYGHDAFIPNRLADLFEARLAETFTDRMVVSNRGNRLEVNSAAFTGDGDPFTAGITDALRQALEIFACYDEMPPFQVDLDAYVPPAPAPARLCLKGCGTELHGVRAVMDHMRTEHPDLRTEEEKAADAAERRAQRAALMQYQ